MSKRKGNIQGHQPRPPSNPEPSDSFSDFSEQVEKRIGNLVQGRAKSEVVSQVLALVKEEFSGPIPHPRYLRSYEDICPGAADRIIMMAEKSLQTQIDIATVETKSEATDRKIGMFFGFGALLALILAAVYCAVNGQTAIAASFIGVGALGTVSRFIHGRGKKVNTKSK